VHRSRTRSWLQYARAGRPAVSDCPDCSLSTIVRRKPLALEQILQLRNRPMQLGDECVQLVEGTFNPRGGR
jgi:hypothetical protein